MAVTVRVNGLSVVHQGSEGVSRATLPDVCVAPPTSAPAPHSNVAFSRDLARHPRSVTVDGHAVAHETSIFARSYGDEAGKLGGVVSGTVGGQASWLTHSFDVRVEGRGVCRLTDKMLHNHGNTVDCAGLVQKQVTLAVKARAAKGTSGKPGAHASKRKKKRGPMEIALPFFRSSMDPNNPTAMLPTVIQRAKELCVTYFRIFLPYVTVSRAHLQILHPPSKPKHGSVVYPYAEIDGFVKAIHAAGFGAEITVHGAASPWAHGQGLFGCGVAPNVTKFARFFEKTVDHYKALGVKRFSVWNEPNHPGFLRAGRYWKTKDGKRRLSQTLGLKALQTLFENANAPALLAVANQRASNFWSKALRKKLPKSPFPAATSAAGGALCDALANKIFGAHVSKAQSRTIAREEHDKKGTRYATFDMKANAKLYRAIFDACWKRTKKKGVKIWLGELSALGAFTFIRYITDPKVTGTKKKLTADAFALHPYQYLVSPTKKPDSRPLFLPKRKVNPKAPKPEQDAAKAWNKGVQKAINERWPANKKKRQKVRKRAASNASMGSLGALQVLLTQLAKDKRLSGRNKKKINLYLTEFGYHRERDHKPQFDRQVPEKRRAKWVKLAYDVAYKSGAKQHLYYHLLPSWQLHEWDSSLLDYNNAPLLTFNALKNWAQRAKKSKKVKLKP